MRTLNHSSIVALIVVTCALIGCEGKPQAGHDVQTPGSDSGSMGEHGVGDEATITEALAQLSPEDRSLAESQKFCAIATANPLGTMGAPLKIEVNGEPVFLCCAGCKSKALSNPEETLASVAKLKAENSVNK